MVQEVHKDNETLYTCTECGFKYREQERAKQCEAWCKEHQSCNIEITKYAVEQ